MRAVVVGAGGRRARRSLVLVGCLVVGVLALGTVEAHAATPSSLAGETLTSDMVSGSTLTGSCGDGTTGGTLMFSISGAATGPFPGTFKESGSFTMGPTGGIVKGFSSTFTITSAAGTVTGSKQLAETSFATCTPIRHTVTFSGEIATTYTATINGAQRTTGPATVTVSGVIGPSVPPAPPPNISESFASTGVVQVTGKEQCKNGGWRSVGFKNQGDCVSFVATGGKNPPSGS
jgi:hypothetical protein